MNPYFCALTSEEDKENSKTKNKIRFIQLRFAIKYTFKIKIYYNSPKFIPMVKFNFPKYPFC